MYKIEIDISGWEYSSETVTIDTEDFDKIAIIQEFIQFQQDHGWAADYELVEDYEYQIDEEVNADDEDDEESEEVEIGELVEDDDGALWERVA
jgi:hypothetical protein